MGAAGRYFDSDVTPTRRADSTDSIIVRPRRSRPRRTAGIALPIKGVSGAHPLCSMVRASRGVTRGIVSSFRKQCGDWQRAVGCPTDTCARGRNRGCYETRGNGGQEAVKKSTAALSGVVPTTPESIKTRPIAVKHIRVVLEPIRSIPCQRGASRPKCSRRLQRRGPSWDVIFAS